MHDWSTMMLRRIGEAKTIPEIQEVLIVLVCAMRQIEPSLDAPKANGTTAALLKFQDRKGR